MAKRKRSHARIWWRTRSDGLPRAWADFREFAAQGGKREPLVAPGGSRATTDPVIAQSLFAKRLPELADARDNETVVAVRRKPGLAEVVKEHLEAKERKGAVTAEWMECAGVFLGRASAFFGEGRRLGSIEVQDVVDWIQYLREVRTHRKGGAPQTSVGRPLSDGTIRHHLNALSNLFPRAQRKKYVPLGYNPVALLERGERPPVPKSATPFLEVPEAALLLEAARTYRRTKREPEMAAAHPILATLLLTGGRKSEVLGLELNDISFDRRTVTFRPNRWRGKDRRGRDRLKTLGSERVVPLWPQLEEILRPHVWERLQAGGSLLFPSPYMTPQAPIGDLRDLLDRVAVHAGFPKGRVRARMLRVTYATGRLQTLDHGAPVARWTVERELGHGSGRMIESVYGKLGEIRHRAEVVEYRFDQHFERCGDRIVTRGGKEVSAPLVRTIAGAFEPEMV
jgi:integrase